MSDIRYKKPGYVALNVTDLDRSVRFYRDLVGLQLESQTADVAFLRCSQDHHNLALYRSADAGIKRMAFQMESDADLANLHEHVESLGWPMHWVDDAETGVLRQGPTLRVRLPECSLNFEFYARIAEAETPFVQTVAKIQRLGHVVFNAKHADAVVKALTEELNFRISDRFADAVTFMRCFPNPYHHSFGVSRSDEDRFHHVNFMVSDVDDIGRGMNRMKNNDVEIVYGPGRHDISTSIFLYFLDPDGMTAEYSFGMEEFAEVAPREPRKLAPLAEILDSWGGTPAANFARRGAVESS